MNKIETIKEAVRLFNFKGELLDDINWLIQQAEKVEFLEKRLNELAQINYCIICGDNATEVRQGQFYCDDCCK